MLLTLSVVKRIRCGYLLVIGASEVTSYNAAHVVKCSCGGIFLFDLFFEND